MTHTDIQEIYFHRLGTPCLSDIRLVCCTDELVGYLSSFETSDNGLKLMISISKDFFNKVRKNNKE